MIVFLKLFAEYYQQRNRTNILFELKLERKISGYQTLCLFELLFMRFRNTRNSKLTVWAIGHGRGLLKKQTI